jgi:glycosyltransferase involved in cell wall biosynthesis
MVPAMSSTTNRVSIAAPGRRFAVVSTFPPTACGIATFSAALAGGMSAHGHDVDAIRIVDEAADSSDHGASPLINQEGLFSLDAFDRLQHADVVVVQHEYGIYPGLDGGAIIPLLDAIERPTIVVAHTVLEHPTAHQRSVLEEIVRQADAVVVMTEAGRLRLCNGFDVDPTKISVIAHGAAVVSTSEPAPVRQRPLLLTWGLLGPGKGIEWAIDALSLMKNLSPRPIYRIAGNTHPKVAALEGDAYRDMLARRTLDRGVSADVQFDAGYRNLDELAALISEATLVVLPYDSPDQVTSGVLVDAIAAGRPVIATAFPHAVELLSSGAGIVVPRRDPQALANAIHHALSSPRLLASMSDEARRLAPTLAWPSVAARYVALGEALLTRRTPVPA